MGTGGATATRVFFDLSKIKCIQLKDTDEKKLSKTLCSITNNNRKIDVNVVALMSRF